MASLRMEEGPKTILPYTTHTLCPILLDLGKEQPLQGNTLYPDLTVLPDPLVHQDSPPSGVSSLWP